MHNRDTRIEVKYRGQTPQGGKPNQILLLIYPSNVQLKYKVQISWDINRIRPTRANPIANQYHTIIRAWYTSLSLSYFTYCHIILTIITRNHTPKVTIMLRSFHRGHCHTLETLLCNRVTVIVIHGHCHIRCHYHIKEYCHIKGITVILLSQSSRVLLSYCYHYHQKSCHHFYHISLSHR